jgi:Peptidase M50B-like
MTHSSISQKMRSREALLALGAFAVVFVLWQSGTDLLYPFRLLTTFVHEAGHGLSAILSGGAFLEFRVFPNGAGVATTAGGSRFLVLNMGYLGAALFGAALFFAANRIENARLVAFFTGLFFAICALLFTGGGQYILGGVVIAFILWLLGDITGNNGNSRLMNLLRWAAVICMVVTLLTVRMNTALLTGLVAAAALVIMSVTFSPQVLLFVLNMVALIIGFNAITDIFLLWNNQSASLGNVPNDAYALARLTNLPTQLWLLVWMFASLAMMGFAAYMAIIRPNRQR